MALKAVLLKKLLNFYRIDWMMLLWILYPADNLLLIVTKMKKQAKSEVFEDYDAGELLEVYFENVDLTKEKNFF